MIEIVKSVQNAQSNVPYLFDCKPRLIKLFFIISCGL